MNKKLDKYDNYDYLSKIKSDKLVNKIIDKINKDESKTDEIIKRFTLQV